MFLHDADLPVGKQIVFQRLELYALPVRGTYVTVKLPVSGSPVHGQTAVNSWVFDHHLGGIVGVVIRER